MKKLLIILSILFFALVTFVSCKPSPEDLVVGTWEADNPEITDMTKLEINADGTFKGYNNVGDPPTEIEVNNGTWSVSGNEITINIEEEYDDTTQQLEPIEEGDIEKSESTFSVTETNLGIGTLLGGNKETLVGTWEGYVKNYEFESETPSSEDSVDVSLVLNDDDTYSFEIPGLGTVDGTSWTYADGNLTLTDGGGSGMDLIFGVSFIGDGLVLTTEGPLAMTFTKAEE